MLLFLFLSTALLATLIMIAWRRRTLPAARTFALLMAAVAVWSLSYAFEIASLTLTAKIFWARMQYLGIVAVPPLWLAFALEYTGRKQRLTSRLTALLFVEPVVIIVLVWTNDLHRLIWRELSFLDNRLPLWYDYGTVFYAHAAYSYLLLLLGSLLVGLELVRPPRLYRGQTITLIIGMLIPWLANVLYLTGLNPWSSLDLTPFAFAISGLVISWGLLHHQLLNILPLARNTLIENMSDAVIVLDAKTHIIDFNPSAQKILNCAYSEIIGRTIAEVFVDYPELCQYSSIIGTDVRSELHTEISLTVKKTGEKRVYLAHVSPLYIEAKGISRSNERSSELTKRTPQTRDNLAGCLILLHDITERKWVEEALRESEEKYRSLVEQSPQGIVVAQGKPPRIVFANRAMAEILGITLEDLLSLSPQETFELVHPEDREIFFQRYKARLEGEEVPAHYEVRTAIRDGSMRWTDLFSSRIEFQGKPAVQGAFMDITELKQMQDALERRNRELAMLYETAIAISSHISLDLVLRTVVERMTQALTYSGCALSLWKPEQNLVETLVDYSVINPNTLEPLGTIYNLDDYPTTRRVLETGEPVLIHREDITADSAEVVLLEKLRVHTLLMLPLMVGDRIIGLIELYNEVKRPDFSPEEIRLAQSMASQATIAIENARLYQQAQQEIEERKRIEESERQQRRLAEALREIVAALCSTFDLDEVLNLILNNLGRVVPHDAANVMLVEKGIARVVARQGYAERGLHEAVLDVRYQVEEVANLRQMCSTGCPLVIPDTSKYQGWILSEETGWIRSYIGTPVRIGEETIGFLNLDSAIPNFFTDVYSDRLRVFADGAAIAIQNAQYYEQAQRHAVLLEERVEERTAELKIANESLQALSRVKDEFVANVSHELRTPITSIQLYHALLGSDPQKNAVYIDRLQRETSRLASIIEGLLQLTRLDLEHVKVKFSTVDLNELAKVYALDRAPLAESKGLTLEFRQEALLTPVQADPQLLSQALSILLTNAFNYTPSGGRIVIRTRSSKFEDKKWAGISVSDEGPGIPPEELNHLFERFFRGRVGLNSGVPGTGLGLSIAKEIVDRHAGRIEVENQGISGEGASFTIWLPMSA